MNELTKLIQGGYFAKAYEFAQARPVEDIKNEIYDLAVEKNISAFAFVNYLMVHDSQNTVRWLGCASTIIYGLFAYLSGASCAGYSYLIRSLEFNPLDNDLIEYQLIFYEVPNEVFSVPEVRNIAKNILKTKPTSAPALDIIACSEEVDGQPVIAWGDGLQSKEKLKVLIEKGRFPQALKVIPQLSWDDQKEIIVTIAHEKNICAYAFVWVLIAEQETADLHLLAAQMFVTDFAATKFAPIKGADAVRVFHERCARELMV